MLSYKAKLESRIDPLYHSYTLQTWMYSYKKYAILTTYKEIGKLYKDTYRPLVS